MQAFRVELSTSRLGIWGVCIVHLWALWLCIQYFDFWLMCLTGVAILGSLWHAWRVQAGKHRDAVCTIWVNTKGQASVRLANQAVEHKAVLLNQSVVSRLFCILIWQVENKRIHQFILPDSLDKDAFRRLRVWAKFGRIKEESSVKHDE